MGDEEGKLLVHQARTIAFPRLIPRKRSQLSAIVSDAKLVNDAFFKIFFSNLYSSEYLPNVWNSHNPLEKITYPKVYVDLTERLGAPTTMAEVKETIRQLQKMKSPGLDGFVAEFYKAYSK